MYVTDLVETCNLGTGRSRHSVSRDVGAGRSGCKKFPGPPQEFLGDTVAQFGDAHDGRIALLHKLVLTWQFVSGQPEGVLDNLLVQITLQLENDLADGNSAGPVVEASLSLSHSALVTTGIHTNVGTDPGVEAVLHSSKSLPDDVLAVFQLGGRNTPVVVQKSNAIVTPNQGGAAGASAGWHAWASFTILLVCAGTGEKPIL